MEIPEILRQFERATGKFATAAVEAAIERREEITPELLKIVEYTISHVKQLEAEGDYMAHFYALFLLAQFREPRAYPLVMRFALIPHDTLYSLCGDFLGEHLGEIVASVCDGNLGPIKSMIENERAEETARALGLSSLVTLVASGKTDREEIVDYFGSLFRGKLARRHSLVWDELVACACDIYPEELMDDIKRAYEDKLIDPHFVTLRDVERDAEASKYEILQELAHQPHRRLITDTVSEMGKWRCFRPELVSPVKHAVAPTPKLEPKLKAGRNDPCPCGSGKKFKKCCGV